jgi:probable addiction module antidote protein
MERTIMAKTETRPYEAAAYLITDEDCANYLDAVIQDSPEDEKLIAAALGDIARARGMLGVARDSGLAREALYRSLSDKGNPSFATVLKVMNALGLQLHVSALKTLKPIRYPDLHA